MLTDADITTVIGATIARRAAQLVQFAPGSEEHRLLLQAVTVAYRDVVAVIDGTAPDADAIEALGEWLGAEDLWLR